MDKRKRIKKKLYPLFCEVNQKEKKYSEIWLSFFWDSDLFFSDDYYILNVKLVDGKVDDRYAEMRSIGRLLELKATEESKSINQVRIIDKFNRWVRREIGDVLVYEDESLE
jgi:hypothetical protein